MTPLNPTRVANIAVHHTASPGTWHLEDVRRTHVGERGWDDVGYHFVVERAHVRLGRPLWLMGAHAIGHNSTTVAVCVVGDFTRTDVPLNQRRRVVCLLADLCGWFSLTSRDIVGHNELHNTDTECPGMAMSEVRDLVEREIARRKQTWGSHGER